MHGVRVMPGVDHRNECSLQNVNPMRIINEEVIHAIAAAIANDVVARHAHRVCGLEERDGT